MQKLTVLIYQKIGARPKNSHIKNEWTSVKTLTRTLDKIKKRHIPTVSPAQILAGQIPPYAVLLVFLDGYRSFYSEVAPLLTARNLAATVCVPAGCIGTYNTWQNPYAEPWQDELSVSEIQTLAQNQLISFGVQSLNREDLSQLSFEQASYVAKESLFRLEKLFPKRTFDLLACWPTRGFLATAKKLVPDFKGLILTSHQISPCLPDVVYTVKRGNSFWTRFIF